MSGEDVKVTDAFADEVALEQDIEVAERAVGAFGLVEDGLEEFVALEKVGSSEHSAHGGSFNEKNAAATLSVVGQGDKGEAALDSVFYCPVIFAWFPWARCEVADGEEILIDVPGHAQSGAVLEELAPRVVTLGAYKDEVGIFEVAGGKVASEEDLGPLSVLGLRQTGQQRDELEIGHACIEAGAEDGGDICLAMRVSLVVLLRVGIEVDAMLAEGLVHIEAGVAGNNKRRTIARKERVPQRSSEGVGTRPALVCDWQESGKCKDTGY